MCIPFLGGVICFGCQQPLRAPHSPEHDIVCNTCGHVYPVIAGRIAVLLSEPKSYLNKFCLYLGRHLHEQDAEIQALAEAARHDSQRASVLASLQEAIARNREYLAALQIDLLRRVSVNDIISESGSAGTPSPYVISLDYLHRDWCDVPEAQKEREVIRDAVLSRIPAGLPEASSALVLGAGAGRLAWELCARFQKVYATDISLTMAYQFHSVLDGVVTTYAVETINQPTRVSMVRTMRAALPPSGPSDQAPVDRSAQLFFFVGDALHVPLPARSVSAVISAYFTDVVPLEPLLTEVVRLLRPGGVFVHFGPLAYHFRDRIRHLAADEVREVFERRGFAIAAEAHVRCTHLASPSTMERIEFDNWVFAAVEKVSNGERHAEGLTLDSVLRVAQDVGYEVHGVISTQGERELDTHLVTPSGERFRGAASVVDILRLLDGVRSVRKVIEELCECYDTGEKDAGGVLDVLRILLSSGLVELVAGDKVAQR